MQSAAVLPPALEHLLVARFDLGTTKPDWALGFRWDIVLGPGAGATLTEEQA